MGAGIAHAFLSAGASVTVIESDDTAVSAAEERIGANLAKAAERGTLAESVDRVRSRLTVAPDPAALAGCGLVVEAVPEVVELKTRVLTRIEEFASEAVLATNTSSLSVISWRPGWLDPSGSWDCISSTRYPRASWWRSWWVRRPPQIW